MIENDKKVQENFFTSNVFLFESNGCTCEKAVTSKSIGEERLPAIKLTSDVNHKIHFAFASKKGLVRLNDDGSIAESNILGKLVAINRNNVKEYFSFFERNGFLIPIKKGKSEVIGMNELKILLDRLQAILELMSTITNMSKESYAKIIRLIFYLLFAPIVSIDMIGEKHKLLSDRHQYCTFLDKNKNGERDPRLEDTFNNENFDFTDNICSFSLNADMVDSILSGNAEYSRYDNVLFHDVFTTYCTPREGKSKLMLYINDFIFHYLYDVGIIDHVELDEIHYVNGTIHEENFNDKLKYAALQTAKYLIKEELEFSLRYVRPTYNISKLEPTWKIDSLLSALYFGLFYMRPNMETYRRCENIKCNEFFLVPVSSRKKRFCCKACMNRTMSARKRARDKIAETKSE